MKLFWRKSQMTNVEENKLKKGSITLSESSEEVYDYICANPNESIQDICIYVSTKNLGVIMRILQDLESYGLIESYKKSKWDGTLLYKKV